MAQKSIIAVVGTGEDDPEARKAAAVLGRMIAKEGWALVSGALGGVMEASCKGASEANGLTIGILPGSDPAEANPYVEVVIASGMGEMRNSLIVRAASAVVAVGGGYGTLSEVALALKTGKPVIGINTWEVSEEIIKANDPKEAISRLKELLVT